MSVIGRLDGQVEEIIINPVGRRRAPDDAPVTPPAARGEPTRAPATANPAGLSGDERRDDEGELPVWLL